MICKFSSLFICFVYFVSYAIFAQRCISKHKLQVALRYEQVVDCLVIGQTRAKQCVLAVLNLQECAYTKFETLLHDAVALFGECHAGGIALNLLEVALDVVDLSLNLRVVPLPCRRCGPGLG